MYQAPNVHPPSVEDVREISQSLGLGIGEKDLGDYHDILQGILSTSYQVLDKYIEPKLPVKYPRTPGHRPQPEENKYNAWYYKTNISGASEGPLKGYKVVVKDSFPVAGVPMMHGSRVVEGYVPDYDPTVITRMLDAGATIIGKAVCEDFCLSGSSFLSHPASVLNPHDPTRSAGGSSSGCAVLVHTKEADLAIGGDQGGSVRMPACWSGIVGHKPTYGLVPYTGLGSLSPAIDYCGPMARTVKDCAILLQVLAGEDGGLDMRQRNIPEGKALPKYSEMLTGDVSGQKIGLVLEGFEGCEIDVAEMVKNVAEKIKLKGATVETVSIPVHRDAEAIWLPTSFEGAYHSIFKGQGFCVGPPSYYPTSAIDNYHAYLSARNRDCSPMAKTLQLVGKYISDKYGMHFYAKSQNLLRYVQEMYDEKLADCDVLIMPTIKFKPRKIPSKDASLKDLHQQVISMLSNAAPFNGTGHPALSLSVGLSEGLPVGMMIIGRHMDDAKVLNVAYAYEQLLKEA